MRSRRGWGCVESAIITPSRSPSYEGEKYVYLRIILLLFHVLLTNNEYRSKLVSFSYSLLSHNPNGLGSRNNALGECHAKVMCVCAEWFQRLLFCCSGRGILFWGFTWKYQLDFEWCRLDQSSKLSHLEPTY